MLRAGIEALGLKEQQGAEYSRDVGCLVLWPVKLDLDRLLTASTWMHPLPRRIRRFHGRGTFLMSLETQDLHGLGLLWRREGSGIGRDDACLFCRNFFDGVPQYAGHGLEQWGDDTQRLIDNVGAIEPSKSHFRDRHITRASLNAIRAMAVALKNVGIASQLDSIDRSVRNIPGPWLADFLAMIWIRSVKRSRSDAGVLWYPLSSQTAASRRC